MRMHLFAGGMRFFFGLSGALFLSWSLACAVAGEKIDERLVVATIRPYALIAEEIAGGRLRVEALLPASASVHTWSPRPGDLSRLAKAGLIVANGLGLETQLDPFLGRMGGRVMRAADALAILRAPDEDGDNGVDGVNAVDGVDEARPADVRSEGDAHDHGGGQNDPHLWADPALMIRFAYALAGRFALLDTEGGAGYFENYAQFSNSIYALDARIREDAARYSRPSLITFHDAFIRFFERYGIARVAAIMPVPGRDPSAARLAEMGGLIQRHGVRALYSEPQLDPKGVRLLAAEYSLPVYVLDPLAADPGITSYASFLTHNWEQMQKGFIR